MGRLFGGRKLNAEFRATINLGGGGDLACPRWRPWILLVSTGFLISPVSSTSQSPANTSGM
jgi:hypothetical protein